MKYSVQLESVREYCEEYPVELQIRPSNNRFVLVAYNYAESNATAVDLLDLLEWLKCNKPELLKNSEV